MTIIRGALRRFDRWTLRTYNPMPQPFGLGPVRQPAHRRALSGARPR